MALVCCGLSLLVGGNDSGGSCYGRRQLMRRTVADSKLGMAVLSCGRVCGDG